MDFGKVNLVTYPLDNSYYRLDAGGLRAVLDALELEGPLPDLAGIEPDALRGGPLRGCWQRSSGRQ